jgi:hypothetical protein
MAEVEASVTRASGAAGSGCARRVARQARLALFKGPVKIRRQGDGMRTLDSGAGESVM